ncbi:outer membrane beta-barrel protein [Agarilytica rhodophyticola]|uniref:outer membrane beta-barrel protein n=1 Tax=Agarilytica rhodophyticola TaxID=1737490 RepID=UPI000B3437F5|nr:outer membrane beta-barrel protein [Agarilytica rhodophyticola]
MNALKSYWILLLILLLSRATFAEIYVGTAVGSTDYYGTDKEVTSIELIGGYRFNDNFALEASWLDFGEATVDLNSLDETKFYIEGTSLSLLAFIPVFHELDVFIKAGLYCWNLESPDITTSAFIRSKNNDNNSDAIYGAGISWYASKNIALRIQYQELDILNENIKNISAGFAYSF